MPSNKELIHSSFLPQRAAWQSSCATISEIRFLVAFSSLMANSIKSEVLVRPPTQSSGIMISYKRLVTRTSISQSILSFENAYSSAIFMAFSIISFSLERLPFGKICQGHKQNFFDKFISSLFLS